jgi:hypothetical protein
MVGMELCKLVCKSLLLADLSIVYVRGHSKDSIQVCGPAYYILCTCWFFMVSICLLPSNPKERNPHFSSYSLYLQLPTMSRDRPPSATCHAISC